MGRTFSAARRAFLQADPVAPVHPVEAVLGYAFRDVRLLDEALTHPSCAENAGGQPFNYQRLEFLGDAVLGLVTAELLLEHYPNASEGNLAKRQAGLVCTSSLAQVARALGLGVHIRMNGSEQSGGGRENDSNLEDVCEALLGALYLDSGFEAARDFARAQWQPLVHAMQDVPKDAKTELQEWAQARGLALPVYTVVSVTGPAHAPEFTVQVSVGQVNVGPGESTATADAFSKRQAEQLAARALLSLL